MTLDITMCGLVEVLYSLYQVNNCNRHDGVVWSGGSVVLIVPGKLYIYIIKYARH